MRILMRGVPIYVSVAGDNNFKQMLPRLQVTDYRVNVERLNFNSALLSDSFAYLILSRRKW